MWQEITQKGLVGTSKKEIQWGSEYQTCVVE